MPIWSTVPRPHQNISACIVMSWMHSLFSKASPALNSNGSLKGLKLKSVKAKLVNQNDVFKSDVVVFNVPSTFPE